MARFVCGTCGATLSADLALVPLPEHVVIDDYASVLTDTAPPALMQRGDYAVDPKPFGPPDSPLTPELARLHDIDDATIAEWQRLVPRPPRRWWGRRAPQVVGESVADTMRLSAGPIGTFVVNPDDSAGTRQHDNSDRLYGCCHLDGERGPNMLCATCSSEVATLRNDCWVGRSTLRFEPSAVRLEPRTQ